MKKFSETAADKCRETAAEIIDEINSLPEMSLSELAPEKTALIIVDAVNGFIRHGAMADSRIESIIPPIVSLMRKCKPAGIPIAAFADCHSENCAEFSAFPPHCIENTDESEIVDEIKTEGGYTLIKKNSTNGFHEAEFAEYLEKNPDRDTFIVTGDCTDICVMQLCLALKTGFTASDKKVDIIIPADCVETYDAPWHSGDFADLAAYRLMKDSGIRFVSEFTD